MHYNVFGDMAWLSAAAFLQFPTGSATGFFFRGKSGRAFIVTNHHVATAAEQAGSVTVHFRHPHAPLSRVPQTYPVGPKDFKRHPVYGGAADVAALLLPNVPQGAEVAAFDASDLPPQSLPIELGSGINITGYPRALQDVATYFPINRHGTIATPYGLAFGGTASFLVDAITHEGSSGSPVTLRASAKASKGPYLLGVHSAALSIPGVADPDPRLFIAQAWYSYLIPETIGDVPVNKMLGVAL